MLGINGCSELTFWSCIRFWLDEVGIEAHLFHERSRNGVRGALGTAFRGSGMTGLEILPPFTHFERLGMPFSASSFLHASSRHGGAYSSSATGSSGGRLRRLC